jgi:hypothetical protein
MQRCARACLSSMHGHTHAFIPTRRMYLFHANSLHSACAFPCMCPCPHLTLSYAYRVLHALLSCACIRGTCKGATRVGVFQARAHICVCSFSPMRRLTHVVCARRVCFPSHEFREGRGRGGFGEGRYDNSGAHTYPTTTVVRMHTTAAVYTHTLKQQLCARTLDDSSGVHAYATTAAVRTYTRQQQLCTHILYTSSCVRTYSTTTSVHTYSTAVRTYSRQQQLCAHIL